MRKQFSIFLLFSLVMAFLMGVVAAETCTPDSGYDVCYTFSNRESYGAASAHSVIKIQSSNVIQGDVHGQYAVGGAWIPYKFTGDEFYLYLNKNSWDSLWNSANCDEDGCSNSNQRLSSVGKYYLVQNPGDSYVGCPAFVAQDYDYDEASNGDWAWSYTYGGWGWVGSNCITIKSVGCYDNTDCGSNQFCDKSGDWNTWSCQSPVCEEGDTQCDGTSLQKCVQVSSSGQTGWQNQGITVGECGIDCSIGDTQCVGEHHNTCVNYSWFDEGLIDGECGYTAPVPDCSGSETKCENTIYYTCSDGNWDSQGLVDGKCGYVAQDDTGDSSIDWDKTLFKLGDFEVTLLMVVLLAGVLLLIIILK